jgi:hypothetical protein
MFSSTWRFSHHELLNQQSAPLFSHHANDNFPTQTRLQGSNSLINTYRNQSPLTIMHLRSISTTHHPSTKHNIIINSIGKKEEGKHSQSKSQLFLTQKATPARKGIREGSEI